MDIVAPGKCNTFLNSRLNVGAQITHGSELKQLDSYIEEVLIEMEKAVSST